MIRKVVDRWCARRLGRLAGSAATLSSVHSQAPDALSPFLHPSWKAGYMAALNHRAAVGRAKRHVLPDVGLEQRT